MRSAEGQQKANADVSPPQNNHCPPCIAVKMATSNGTNIVKANKGIIIKVLYISISYFLEFDIAICIQKLTDSK